MKDQVNSPDHYRRAGVEVIDVIEAFNLDYRLGNVIKYVCRSQFKGDPEMDLRKAEWYLNRALSHVEAGGQSCS